MKRIISAAMFLLVFTSFLSLNAQWAIIYGGTGSDSAYSIQQTNDGGYIVAGETNSFGAGGSDVWILKLTSSGDIEWQKTYGGIVDDCAWSIQQTGDGGYIVAGETGSFGARDKDIWILKLSSTGAIEWQRTYGGSEWETDPSIQQTNDGGYIVVGHTESFGVGGADIWILKLSSAGDIEWQRTYGAGEQEYAPSIQQTSDGGYIVAGHTYSVGVEMWGYWILKLSPEGDIGWQKTYGWSTFDKPNSIQQTSDGGYIVIGETSSFGAGSSDIWILKLSSDGDIEWQKTYGGTSYDEALSIQQTNDGGYIVAGSTDSFGAGSSDVWILKLTSSGDIGWQKTYGGSGSDSASSIQQTSDGGYIVTGYIISWGAGSRDFWVLKLSSDGDINPRCSFIRSSKAAVSDTDNSPEDTNTTPMYEDITPQDTNITPQDTDATVYNLCSEKPLLGILISGGGTTVPAPGTYIHEPGTEITITAFPKGGYSFGGWSGDASGETSPITIIMDSDKSIRADFWQDWGGGDGKDGIKTGGCFIATAAYGSPLHPYVKILRNFRDTCLIPSEPGRAFVRLYYKYSPFAADLISKHKALKGVIRINLLPIIAISYSILHLGPIITIAALIFIFMLPVFFIWRHQRKLRRHMRGRR